MFQHALYCSQGIYPLVVIYPLVGIPLAGILVNMDRRQTLALIGLVVPFFLSRFYASLFI